MNKTSKIMIGVMVLTLLVALDLCFRESPDAMPLVATPDYLTPDATEATDSAPAAPTAPTAPPAQSGVETPAAPPASAPASPTDPDVAALSAAAADISKLFQERDFAAIAKNYFPPGVETSFVADNQRLQAEGKAGQYRLDQIAGVFAALVGQTPIIIKNDPNQVMFYDRTLYTSPPVPPEAAALMTPEQIDQTEGIPVYFTKENGHWYVTGPTFGLLETNVYNIPLPKEIEDSPDDSGP